MFIQNLCVLHNGPSPNLLYLVHFPPILCKHFSQRWWWSSLHGSHFSTRNVTPIVTRHRYISPPLQSSSVWHYTQESSHQMITDAGFVLVTCLIVPFLFRPEDTTSVTRTIWNVDLSDHSLFSFSVRVHLKCSGQRCLRHLLMMLLI